MRITAPTILCPGLAARPTSRGLVAIDLDIEADPVTWTPEVTTEEMRRLGCRENPDGTWNLSWRWRKENRRDFDAQTGQPVFDETCMSPQQPNLRNPLRIMDLGPDGKLMVKPVGRVRIYVEPTSQPPVLPANVQSVARFCGIGLDVGAGTGASDSAGVVLFADNREQAAEFGDNRTSPGDLARLAAAVGHYYHQAMICCVGKMHGLTCLRTLADDLHYPFIWHHRTAQRVVELASDKLGWMRGESTDLYLFGDWQDALAHQQAILHSLTTAEQHRRWVYDKAGQVCHQDVRHLPSEQRRQHGDYVVACALAWRACCDLPAVRWSTPKPLRPIEREIQKTLAARNTPWRR